jgi:hypothetical protein
MLHHVTYVPPRPGMSEHAAKRHWLDVQGPRYARGLPEIHAYLIATTLRSTDGRVSPLGMGSAEMWLAGGDQWAALLRAEAFHRARGHEPDFSAYWRATALLTEDHVLVPGPGPVAPKAAVKLQLAVKRRAGLALETFRQRALVGLGALVPSVPGLLRHVQCHAVDRAYAVGEPALDAVFQLWFPTSELARKAQASEPYAELSGELAAIAEPRWTHTLLTREHWYVKPR